MNKASKPIHIKRILVSLDSSSHSFAALKAAVQITRHFDANLKGIFIEDISVLNLAEMPHRSEIGEYTAIVREISGADLQQGVLIQAKWVLRTFRKLVRQEQIQGQFTVRRGDVLEIINQESETCDLLIIGKSGTNYLLRRRFGSTAKALIQRRKKPILLLENGNRIGYPLIVLYHNTPLGKTCLETGRALLSRGDNMIVLLSKDDPDNYTENKRYLREWAADRDISITLDAYQRDNLERILHQINGIKTGLLILPHTPEASQQKILNTLLNRVDLPILLISDMPTEE